MCASKVQVKGEAEYAGKVAELWETNVQEERVQEVKDGILETWGVWLFYVWPMRLTREGCEEVHIEKKQRFRIRAAAKEGW